MSFAEIITLIRGISWLLGEGRALTRWLRLHHVFGSCYNNEVPLTIIMSARDVEHYKEPTGFTFRYRDDERGVTNIKDAEGLAQLLSFLRLEGKKSNLCIRYAGGRETEYVGNYVPEDLKANVFLFGSPISNQLVENELRECELKFDQDCRGIKREDGTSVWRDQDTDYAILAKRIHGNRFRFVAAGIGPSGTAAAAIFLTTPFSYTKIAKKYGGGEFAILLKIEKGLIYNAKTIPSDLLR